MLTLYCLLIILFLIALSILAIPFVLNATENKSSVIKHFFVLSFLTSVFVFSFYFFTEDLSSVTQWINHGKAHYQLMIEYNQLGGIDGLIKRVKEKLKNNPNDIQGWLILSKLYQTKHEEEESKKAFEKARILQTNLSVQ